DPTAMYANQLSAAAVGQAVASTNVVIPSGTARMGDREFNIDLNMSPTHVPEFNGLPIKAVAGITGGTPAFLSNPASATDSHQPQNNFVRVDHKRATYLMIIKHAGASTLAIVDAVKQVLPEIRTVAPKGLKMALAFDQSRFVRDALWEVVQEAVTAAGLV